MSERERERDATERRDHVLRTRARKSRLPEKYITGLHTLDTFPTVNKEDGDAVLTVREWLALPRLPGDMSTNSLFLHGPIGVGKSGLAACAIAASLSRVPAIYITKIELMQVIQRTFDNAGNELDALREFTEVPRLALDDLDKGAITPFVLRILWALIDYRSRHNVPTIFTCNADQAGLYHVLAIPGGEVTAEAIVDRIRGMCIDVPMTGESKR